MAYPDAQIHHFGTGGTVEMAYRDTGHFTVTHDLLVNPERMMRTLFDQ